jgi:hypothetical protein
LPNSKKPKISPPFFSRKILPIPGIDPAKGWGLQQVLNFCCDLGDRVYLASAQTRSITSTNSGISMGPIDEGGGGLVAKWGPKTGDGDRLPGHASHSA